MKQQQQYRDFSIQDWKSDYFYNLLESEEEGVATEDTHRENLFIFLGGNELLKHVESFMGNGVSYKAIKEFISTIATMTRTGDGLTGDQIITLLDSKLGNVNNTDSSIQRMN